MDWLLGHRWSVLGGCLAVLALGGAVVAVAVTRSPEEVTATASSTTAAGSATTTAPTSTTTSAPPTTRSTTTSEVAASPAPTTAPPTTTTTTTAPTTTTATTEPAPPYRSSIETVTAEQLGASWTPGRGCTAPADLRAVNVTHWGYDGSVHQGRLVVAASQAEAVAAIFGDIYAARFPIQQIVPIERYGADDQASMRANNTSGYNCRTVAGTDTLSNHAYGLAIDINPLHNPYVQGSRVDPPEGEPWADRSRDDPGMIRAEDAVVRAFAARGWRWGGYWSNPDYQHFDI